MDFTALRTEVTTDPLALGYAAKTDAEAAVALNLVRDGTAGKTPLIQVKRQDVSSQEILEAIDLSDAAASPHVTHVGYFESATQQGTLRLVDDAGVDTRVLQNIGRLFVPAGTGTRARIKALGVKPASRQESLKLGEVTPGDVGVARSGNF